MTKIHHSATTPITVKLLFSHGEYYPLQKKYNKYNQRKESFKLTGIRTFPKKLTHRPPASRNYEFTRVTVNTELEIRIGVRDADEQKKSRS